MGFEVEVRECVYVSDSVWWMAGEWGIQMEGIHRALYIAFLRTLPSHFPFSVWVEPTCIRTVKMYKSHCSARNQWNDNAQTERASGMKTWMICDRVLTWSSECTYRDYTSWNHRRKTLTYVSTHTELKPRCLYNKSHVLATIKLIDLKHSNPLLLGMTLSSLWCFWECYKAETRTNIKAFLP